MWDVPASSNSDTQYALLVQNSTDDLSDTDTDTESNKHKQLTHSTNKNTTSPPDGLSADVGENNPSTSTWMVSESQERVGLAPQTDAVAGASHTDSLTNPDFNPRNGIPAHLRQTPHNIVEGPSTPLFWDSYGRTIPESWVGVSLQVCTATVTATEHTEPVQQSLNPSAVLWNPPTTPATSITCTFHRPTMLATLIAHKHPTLLWDLDLAAIVEQRSHRSHK